MTPPGLEREACSTKGQSASQLATRQQQIVEKVTMRYPISSPPGKLPVHHLINVSHEIINKSCCTECCVFATPVLCGLNKYCKIAFLPPKLITVIETLNRKADSAY
ncbi:hypothetical protein CEXT_247241 [Caerostris extrusa]|uniref:Uncharacterized protein n=1 Tax=Caerostris extrusa TaxID=172846 RepID=A0AAV4MEJ5_CAEEX|nr:hypothetical protein CEXT_247241 [Caerostris extrusa]